MAQLIERLATVEGWSGVRMPAGGARISTQVPTKPGAHPASCTMGTVSLSRRGGKSSRAFF